MILEIIALLSLAVAAYHFFLYPGFMILLAKVLRADRPDRPDEMNDWPSVALIVAAYNEEKVIAQKVHNSLALDYPADRLQIVIVSDGSSDRTPEIVAAMGNPRMLSLHQPERRGKSHALNRAVAAVSADIVVLSDANNDYSVDSIKKLVARLRKPGVGGVTGVKKVVADASREASTGDGIYWKYESQIKAAESALGGTVTGDGEIFALHRELYPPIPPEVINDDMYITLRLVEAGYSVEYEPGAVAVEQGSMTINEDYNVKVRMIAGGFQCLAKEWRAVFCSGWFSVKFLSHKIFRWTMPVFLLALLLTSASLVAYPLYRLLLAGQIIVYGAALIGWATRNRGTPTLALYVPFYFLTMNVAAGAGLVRFLRGKHSALWTKASR